MASPGLIHQISKASESLVGSSSNTNSNEERNRSHSASNNNGSSSGSNSNNNRSSRASGSSTLHESGKTSTTSDNHDNNRHTAGTIYLSIPTPAKAKSEETSHSVSEAVVPLAKFSEYSKTIPNIPAETSELSSSRPIYEYKQSQRESNMDCK